MCWGPLLKLTMALRIGVCSWASFCPIQSAVVSHGISIHLAALCSVVSFLIIDVNAASLSWQIHEGFFLSLCPKSYASNSVYYMYNLF